MEANHASDAVVAVVRLYTGLLGEKQDTIGVLRQEGAMASVLFARLRKAVEKSGVHLCAGSFEEVTQLVEATLDAAAKNAQILFEHAGRMTKLANGLREAIVIAGGEEPPETNTTLETLVAAVSKAIVDLKAGRATPGESESARVRSNVVAAAIAWAQAPRSKAKIDALVAAVDQRALYELEEVKLRQLHRLEGEVLTAAREYANSTLETEAETLSALGEAADRLNDLKAGE